MTPRNPLRFSGDAESPIAYLKLSDAGIDFVFSDDGKLVYAETDEELEVTVTEGVKWLERACDDYLEELAEDAQPYVSPYVYFGVNQAAFC
jgi:hypothetical protein